MLFRHLVETANAVAARGSRLAKSEALATLLRELPNELIRPAVALLSGVLPSGRIGIGYAAVREARPQRHAEAAALSLEEILATLEQIATAAGPGSKSRKIELLSSLLERATAPEADFLVRVLVGELRQGALQGVMVEALARAANIEARLARRAAMLSGDLPLVAEAALLRGSEGLAAIGIEIFRPLQPMLAAPVADVEALIQRFESGRGPDAFQHLLLEHKIDGARIQVHKQGGAVRVYSRQLNDVTAAIPEVAELCATLPADSIVLDGEAYAVRDDGRPQPFQVTMRRFGRRRRVDELRRELPIETKFFDCIWHDGEQLIDEPLRRRRERLVAVLGEERCVSSSCVGEWSAVDRYFEMTLEAGHEGVMAKDLESGYEAGSRGFSWLKLKPSHTLDLVVLAAEWGSGRRRGKLSNIHLGARDEATGELVMLGKTFKGLTDEMLAWQTQRFLELQTSQEGEWVVHIRPELVVEIAFNNVQASPQYPAGMALRFARVKRYRDDKTAAQASTLAEVRAIFEHEHGRAGEESPSRSST